VLAVLASTDPLEHVGVGLAALAGLASFLSPCVLPLVPAYLAFLSARAGQLQLAGAGPAGAVAPTSRGSVLASGLAFVAGLSLVFIAFFYVLFTAVQPIRNVVPVVAGVFVLVLAAQTAGFIRIPFLMREYKVTHNAPTRGGIGGGFLLGVSFASGWTPCIGATLGAVLSSAVTVGTTGRGLLLISAYCLGLGLPFLLIAFGIEHATPLVRTLNRHRRAIDLGSAAVLAVMGLLLLTNRLTVLSSVFNNVMPGFLGRFSL
jgi:cytochrome c-type biogenesis protein